jgi:hypothetical protein
LKAERPNHRVVPVRRFDVIDTVDVLVERLFANVSHEQILRAHFRERFGKHAGTMIADALPDELTWSNSAELAMLVDGYELAKQAQLGDPFTLYEPRIAEARRTGRWAGDLLELWTMLFLEHRRWRQASPYAPDTEVCQLLDRLCAQLQAALGEANHL